MYSLSFSLSHRYLLFCSFMCYILHIKKVFGSSTECILWYGNYSMLYIFIIILRGTLWNYVNNIKARLSEGRSMISISSASQLLLSNFLYHTPTLTNCGTKNYHLLFIPWWIHASMTMTTDSNWDTDRRLTYSAMSTRPWLNLKASGSEQGERHWRGMNSRRLSPSFTNTIRWHTPENVW